MIVLQTTLDYLIKNQMAVELDRLMGVNKNWHPMEKSGVKYFKLDNDE